MGRHLLLEVYDVKYNLLNDVSSLENIIHSGIIRSRMNILNTYTHQFTPHGLTILVCLSESHVSVHTFPENNCVSVDAYTCGDGNPKIIILELLKYFDSYNYNLREIYR